MMTLILLNCVFLAMDSGEPGSSDHESVRAHARPAPNPDRRSPVFVNVDEIQHSFLVVNRPFSRLNPSPRPESHRKAVDNSENIFLSLFCGEMVIKIVAMGFFVHPNSYLRDSWNRLDFTVVILGIIAAMNLGNFSAIRTVRVLRPLRTLQGFAGMRQLVVTLLNSLPLLGDVAVLMAFLFFLLGLMGVQLFSGALNRRCASLDNPNAGCHLCGYDVGYAGYNASQIASGCASDCALPTAPRWTVHEETTCGGPRVSKYPSKGGKPSGYSCPDGQWCIAYEAPNHDITSFDNILGAWLAIFQCISLEGWVDIMYWTQGGERVELVVLRGDDHHRLVLRHQPRARGAVRQLHHRAQDGQGAALGSPRRGEGGKRKAPEVDGERGRVPGGAGGGLAAASERRVAGAKERAAVTVDVPARLLRRGDSARRRRRQTARRAQSQKRWRWELSRMPTAPNARDDDERRARGRRGGATTERLRQRFPPGEVRQRDGDAASDADG